MNENFRPIRHVPPNSLFNKIRFFLRVTFDFQVNTVYKHLNKRMSKFKGKILDIGCGESPYKHLLNQRETEYFGIDIQESKNFDYNNCNIIHFDGKKIPFDDNAFDHIICTEVIEHIIDPSDLISEIYRVLKKGGNAIITVPWSARYHYIPNDYHRYTPAMLEILFKNFKSVTIFPRGTDISVIASKIMVSYLSFITKITKFNFISIILIPINIVAIPILIIAIFIGHFSLIFKLGNEDGPLGYTIFVYKN